MRETDKSDFDKLFPLPLILIPTTGTQDGVILRFKTFYIKIYDAKRYEDGLVIQGFRYNETNPVFEEEIQSFHLKEFASQFNREDYLINYRSYNKEKPTILSETTEDSYE